MVLLKYYDSVNICKTPHTLLPHVSILRALYLNTFRSGPESQEIDDVQHEQDHDSNLNIEHLEPKVNTVIESHGYLSLYPTLGCFALRRMSLRPQRTHVSRPIGFFFLQFAQIGLRWPSRRSTIS